MTLDLEQIKSLQAGSPKEVEVPCWGGTVKVRSFSMGTALDVRDAGSDEQKLIVAASKLIIEPDLDNEAGRQVLLSMTPTDFNDLWERISEASGIDLETEKKS